MKFPLGFTANNKLQQSVMKSNNSLLSRLVIVFAIFITVSGFKLFETDRYKTKDEKVIWLSPWGNRIVEEADYKTFKYIGGIFGADSRHVFFGNEIVTGADPKTFIVIDSYSGKDSRSIFNGKYICEECDVNTFEVFDKNWYFDKYRAYYRSGNSMNPVEGVDQTSFKMLNNLYYKDKSRVYFYDDVVRNADAPSFKTRKFGCGVCGEDKNICYVNTDAVPCDDKAYGGGAGYAWASPLYITDETKASIESPWSSTKDGDINLDLIDGKGKEPLAWFSIVEGWHDIDFSCNKKSEVGKFKIFVKAKHIYKLQKVKGNCQISIEKSTFIKGKLEDPEMSFKSGKQDIKNETEWNLIQYLKPDESNVITVRCRKPTREKFIEDGFVTEFVPQNEHMYQIQGGFEGEKCIAKIIDLGPG